MEPMATKAVSAPASDLATAACSSNWTGMISRWRESPKIRLALSGSRTRMRTGRPAVSRRCVTALPIRPVAPMMAVVITILLFNQGRERHKLDEFHGRRRIGSDPLRYPKGHRSVPSGQPIKG